MASVDEDKGKNVHLLEDERAVIVKTDVPEDYSVRNSLLLVGSLYTSRPFDSFALKASMKAAWKVKKGFLFRELRNNLFVFHFADNADKEKVLKGGPWSFDKTLLVLRDPGNEQPSQMVFTSTELWVRIYDLPLTAMVHEVAKEIGSALGDLVAVDESEIGICWRFIRIRVLVDLRKPLKRGLLINVHGKPVWVLIRYERLPYFCYSCGRIGHMELDCEDVEPKVFQNEYREWLRASPVKVIDRQTADKMAEQSVRAILRNSAEQVLQDIDSEGNGSSGLAVLEEANEMMKQEMQQSFMVNSGDTSQEQMLIGEEDSQIDAGQTGLGGRKWKRLARSNAVHSEPPIQPDLRNPGKRLEVEDPTAPENQGDKRLKV